MESKNGKYHVLYEEAQEGGICGPVRLRYGNTLITEGNQNNDEYLAKYQVPAVDPETFQGQSGEYTFRPKWYEGRTSYSIFGCPVKRVSDGVYYALTDGSSKGNIGWFYAGVITNGQDAFAKEGFESVEPHLHVVAAAAGVLTDNLEPRGFRTVGVYAFNNAAGQEFCLCTAAVYADVVFYVWSVHFSDFLSMSLVGKRMRLMDWSFSFII